LTEIVHRRTFNCFPNNEVLVPLSAVDSVSPAFHHTKQQLFRPFRLGQWTKLALVGLFAGEMGNGGGSGGTNFHIPASTSDTHRHFPGIPHIDPALLGLLVVLLIVILLALWLLFLYINSRMRFVLFDSVLSKKCSIRQMWRARGEPAMHYFIWQVVFSLVTFAGFVVVVGIPALIAFLLGWFSPPSQHVGSLVLAGIGVFLVFVALMIGVVCVYVFTKDFVVPQMALENISAFEGWRRLLRMLQSEKGGYAAYAGMKFILALGAAFAVGIVTIVLVIILLIPIGGLGILSVLLAKAAGLALSWTVLTVTAAVVAGCVFLFLLLYAIALISVPVIVFFPAYSIYFFASRYQRLADVIYPAAPTIPPTPPMPPAPEPA
jgi:hypothetical protein